MAGRESMKDGNLRFGSISQLNIALIMVGYSLYKAVAYNSYVTNYSATTESYGYISNMPFMNGATAGILVASIIIFIVARMRIIGSFGLMYRWPLFVIAFCYIVSPFFAESPNHLIAYLGLGFVWGLTTTIITIVWVELFAYVEFPSTFILLLACGSLFSAVISILVAQFSQTFNIILCVAMSLLCVPIISRCRKNLVGVSAGEGASATLLKSPERAKQTTSKRFQASRSNHYAKSSLKEALEQAATPILAYFFFELVIGMINMFAYESPSSFAIAESAPVVGMIVCSALVVVFVFITNRTPSPSAIYLFIFPLIISIFLLLPIFGDSFGKELSSVVYAAYVFTSMLSMFCYVEAIRKTGANVYQLASLVSGGVRIMLTIGLILGYVISHMMDAEAYMRLSIVVVVGVYFLGVVIMFWGYSTAKNRKLSLEEPQGKAVEKQDSLLLESYEDMVSDKVEELVETYKLTKRERDVLLGLSKGNSAARIAEDLFISTHTAQGYIKSLYVKLGVNKKQQVLDLFHS